MNLHSVTTFNSALPFALCRALQVSDPDAVAQLEDQADAEAQEGPEREQDPGT